MVRSCQLECYFVLFGFIYHRERAVLSVYVFDIYTVNIFVKLRLLASVVSLNPFLRFPLRLHLNLLPIVNVYGKS